MPEEQRGSRKAAKSRTRGRKPYLTEAKARVSQAPKTRADLEQQLKAYRREIARIRERLADATMQQTATSEMLRLISHSPIQSVLDAVAENAARLCDASNARIWRLDDNVLRLVATYGESPATMDGREGLPADRATVAGRAAHDRRTIHVHDIEAEVSEYPVGSRIVKGQGWHTTLATPLLREGKPFGTILVRRTEVRPFHDQQIALLEAFAGQAAIAIENVRLFEVEKQRSLALARANEAIRESEHRHRQIIDTVPSLLWSAGPDGEPTYVNQRILDYTGTRQEDFRHRGWEAFLHPDDLPETAQAFYRAVQTGTSHEAVHRIRQSDGEYRWHHTRAEPLRDQQGRIVQWYGVSVDIDERKKAEERLRRSEAYLAEAQKLTRMGSWVWDPRTEKVLYCSEEMFRIFGLDPRESSPSRDNFRQQIHPEDRDWVKKRFERSLREKADSFAEYRVLLPDGTVRHINATGHVVLDEGGELIEFIGTATDVTERKRAEEALRESEARIRRLVDSNIIGIFIWDFDGRILEANDEFLRMVNYDREDLVAGRMRWAELTPPDWRDRNDARIEEQKGRGRFEPFEKEYTRKDGSRVPVLIGGATFEEGGNEGVAYVVDLTERKRAEEALRESEYKLRQIIETVPILLWSSDANGEPTHINQRMLDYSGMRSEEFKQGGWHAFIHPDDLPGTLRAFSHAIQTGTSYQHVNRLRRADGEFRWHDTRGEPLRDRQGRVIQWYGLSVDIDEGKKAEDRLRRSEAYLAEAQRLSRSGVSAYNETAILFGSEETYRIWGFDPAEGVPSREAVFQRIHPDDRGSLFAEVQRAVSEKRDYSTAYRIVLPDGTIKYLEVFGRPAFTASGELVEIVTTQIDVTERKCAEEALRAVEAQARENEQRYRRVQLELAHANRVATMGQLTSSIAHEVNQPITAAVTYALAARRWLNAEPPNFREADDALSLIVKEGNRAGEVVSRIRAMAKKAPARKDAVAINDTVLEVISLTRTEAANNSVAVRTQLAEGLPHVQGDRVQLQQVLLNLIINAIEAMRDVGEEQRELLIGTSNEPDGVSVEVKDTGPGLMPEALDRVFEAFYTTKSGGMGLGLSICRSIIEAHNGRLWASPNVPRGAIFRFTAPAYSTAAP